MNTNTRQSKGRKLICLLHRMAAATAVSFTLFLLSVASNRLHAGTITVTSTADDGAGSLRAAVAAAADGDEISFSLPTPATLTLTTGELALAKNLTISGPGPAILSISGNTNGRVFTIAADRTVNLSGLAIRSGRANSGEGGGGVYNAGGLTLRNCDVSFNTAGNGTPALAGGNGGGIFNAGSLNVTGCSFRSNFGGTGNTGNSMSAFGGSMTTGGPGGGGGAIFNSGSLTLDSCTFYDNHAGTGGTGGGTSLGGVAASGGTGGTGGGVFNTGVVVCTSSTFSVNHAGEGGRGGSAISVFDGGYGGQGGTGGTAGGIYNGGSPASVTLRNSIVALNVLGEAGPGGYGVGASGPNGNPGTLPDVSGAFTSRGHNLVGASDGSTGLTNGVSGNIAGTTNSPVNPWLGALQDNGGPTWTMLLLAGSPAIDAGDDTLTGTDQRGLPRLSGAGVDIGASEGVSTLFSRSEALLVGNGLNNSIAAIEVRSGAAVGTFVQPAAGASYRIFGPRGMLCAGNQLLVVNQNVDTPYNGEVLRFDLYTGALTGKMVSSSNANAPYAPRGMIAAPNGVLYVADVGGFDGVHPGRIARYNSQGVFLGNVNTTGLSVPFYPMGLVIGPDGLLYVAGVGDLTQGSLNGFVFRFQFNAGTQNYHYLSTIVSSTAANFYAPGLHAPEGIVFGPGGNLYVVSFYADYTNSQGGSVTDRDAILAFNKSGQKVGSPIYLYEANDTRVFAQAMLFGPRGDLFVSITSDRGVRRYSASSSFQQFTVLPSAGASPGQPWYLTFRATNPGTLAYEPPQLTAMLIGGRVDISWPANYVGWQLQIQTNGLSPDHWVDVANSTGTHSFSLLPNPADASTFFRLAAP